MYIIGILIGLYLQISIAFLCVILFVLFIISYIFSLNNNKKRQSRILFLICLCVLLIGCIYVKTLNKNYEERYSEITGTINIKAIIISNPDEKEYKYTYTIKVEEINGNKEYQNTKLLLDIKKSNLKESLPQYGDEITITGEFKKPNTARNYKGFDYEEYLRSQKTYGTITSEKYEIISSNKTNIFNNFIHYVQGNIKENMHYVLDEEEAALCVGILVGDREDISEQTEDNFQKSNLTHMLAVSGSHITYIINAMAVLLSRVGKRRTKILTIIILIFFMALTGFTSSVIRACIMGILVLLASIIHRKSDTINNLGISALIILIFNPYAIVDVGFLLSYGGTIGIVVLGDRIANSIYKIIDVLSKGKINLIESEKNTIKSKVENQNKGKRILKYLVNSFSITLSANLIIIPIMAYNFSTVSITFWISNILAAPIMEIVTIFGFIVYFISIIFIPFAQFLGIFLNIFLKILLKIAEVSSLIPGSSIYIKTPYIIECIIYYLLIFVMVKFRDIKNIIKGSNIISFLQYKSKKIISCICIIVIVLFSFFTFIFPKSLKIYFVDVGQGDCTLIITPENKNILVDGGGSEFSSFDVGENTLLPYLLARRITTIDYIMISHFDSDHIGGLFTIMENLEVKNIIISKQGEESDNLTRFLEIVNDKRINVIIVSKGDYLQIDKYSYFEILFPEDNMINNNILNNNSIVAKFNSLGLSMLFTGDIEEIAENRLYELYKGTDKLNATILKVAHHGSKTSSTDNFLELVSPQIAFIGVGENNNYGHPNSDVLDRIELYTDKIYRTDENGEIELSFRNGKIRIRTKIF